MLPELVSAHEARLSELSATDARILDAAAELAGAIGLDATMDQIARRAGVGRATVFRRFGGKEAIFQQMLSREIGTGLSAISRAAREIDDGERRAVRVCEMLFEACVSHPIIRHLARSDPAALATLTMSEDPSPSRLVREALADFLGDAHRPAADRHHLELVADVFAHTVAGYMWMIESVAEEGAAELRTLVAEQTVAAARPRRT